ncbi:MAG: hypothetical protein H6698_06160 [Myxococcales bacterium]|nr:hypothetical protein [Myxococcales bacterium]MCB9533890.1 hypothetical protein [Myxococcales bacterium]
MRDPSTQTRTGSAADEDEITRPPQAPWMRQEPSAAASIAGERVMSVDLPDLDELPDFPEDWAREGTPQRGHTRPDARAATSAGVREWQVPPAGRSGVPIGTENSRLSQIGGVTSLRSPGAGSIPPGALDVVVMPKGIGGVASASASQKLTPFGPDFSLGDSAVPVRRAGAAEAFASHRTPNFDLGTGAVPALPGPSTPSSIPRVTGPPATESDEFFRPSGMRRGQDASGGMSSAAAFFSGAVAAVPEPPTPGSTGRLPVMAASSGATGRLRAFGGSEEPSSLGESAIVAAAPMPNDPILLAQRMSGSHTTIGFQRSAGATGAFTSVAGPSSGPAAANSSAGRSAGLTGAFAAFPAASGPGDLGVGPTAGPASWGPGASGPSSRVGAQPGPLSGPPLTPAEPRAPISSASRAPAAPPFAPPVPSAAARGPAAAPPPPPPVTRSAKPESSTVVAVPRVRVKVPGIG